MGVVKVMVEPETEAICFTSAVGRSVRENQEPAVLGVVGNASGAKSSTYWIAGLCFCQTTRQSGEAQIFPRPCGSGCQPAPEASSSNTIWPGDEARGVCHRHRVLALDGVGSQVGRAGDVGGVAGRREQVTGRR